MSIEFNPKKLVLTIWQDGSWKIWSVNDAYYARNDPSWLSETGIEEIFDECQSAYSSDAQLRLGKTPDFKRIMEESSNADEAC